MSANESNIRIYLSLSKRGKENYWYYKQIADQINRKYLKNSIIKEISDPYHIKKINQVRICHNKTFKTLTYRTYAKKPG